MKHVIALAVVTLAFNSAFAAGPKIGAENIERVNRVEERKRAETPEQRAEDAKQDRISNTDTNKTGKAALSEFATRDESAEKLAEKVLNDKEIPAPRRHKVAVLVTKLNKWIRSASDTAMRAMGIDEVPKSIQALKALIKGVEQTKGDESKAKVVDAALDAANSANDAITASDREVAKIEESTGKKTTKDKLGKDCPAVL